MHAIWSYRIKAMQALLANTANEATNLLLADHLSRMATPQSESMGSIYVSMEAALKKMRNTYQTCSAAERSARVELLGGCLEPSALLQHLHARGLLLGGEGGQGSAAVPAPAGPAAVWQQQLGLPGHGLLGGQMCPADLLTGCGGVPGVLLSWGGPKEVVEMLVGMIRGGELPGSYVTGYVLAHLAGLGAGSAQRLLGRWPQEMRGKVPQRAMGVLLKLAA